MWIVTNDERIEELHKDITYCGERQRDIRLGVLGSHTKRIIIEEPHKGIPYWGATQGN